MLEKPEDLELMPRAVRDKLDRAGIKVHLREWQQLSKEERRRLVEQPCGSEADVERYARDLTELIRRRCGKEPEKLDP